MPRCNFVKVALGGAVRRVIPACQLVSVAATPAISRALAISPTDWAHSGQAGTKNAALAFSASAIDKMGGIVSCTTLVRSG